MTVKGLRKLRAWGSRFGSPITRSCDVGAGTAERSAGARGELGLPGCCSGGRLGVGAEEAAAEEEEDWDSESREEAAAPMAVRGGPACVEGGGVEGGGIGV